MSKAVAAVFSLLMIGGWASAQQIPMSAPARPPVPMTDSDQARAAEQAKKKVPDTAAPPQAVAIKVPLASSHHPISSGNAAVDALVYEAAAQNGLDPCLILSVMRAESAFNRMAISPKGASGLMQLMPETAARFGVKNIFDPRENVFGGARYLRWLLDRFSGDVRLALAGYNAGEGAVEMYGLRIPPFLETQNYVRIIYTRYSGIHTNALPEKSPVTIAPQVAEPVKEKNPTYNQIIRFTSSTGEVGKAGK